MRVLTISDDMLYVHHGGCILYLHAHDMSKVARRIDLSRQLPLKQTKLVARLFRLSVNFLYPVAGESLVLTVNRRIIRYDLASKFFSHSFGIPRGKRFLFLCLGQCNELYFGEYFGNEDRRAVHIYRSMDGGCSFEIVHTFPAKTVRHIHGVFYDPYTGSIWITTGDSDEESGIWVTDDRFRTLNKVIGGSQQTRAVQLLFTESHVYFGSDTPLEKNHIYRMDKKTSRAQRLQEVQSSVFWGCKVGESLFFSTAVEPSKVNRCRDSCIWGSKDGETWKCIARFRKDIWPMKLFQYGQIFFPAGENNTGYLWFTPFATQKHLTLQRLDVSEIFNWKRIEFVQ